MTYRGALLPAEPAIEEVATARPDYEAMLVTVMAALADRYERSPDYPFVDTKLDLRTGRDFDPADPVRGRGTIYGWIQGRGLEALAGHGTWMQSHPAPEVRALAERLERMAAQVLACLRRLRQRNRGRLHFYMKPDGTPFRLGPGNAPEPLDPEDGADAGFSDLFGAKGMLAAARFVGSRAAESEALEYCRAVDAAVLGGRFRSDQQPLDPRNPVTPVPGRFTHGPYMLQLASAGLRLELGCDTDPGLGLRFFDHELDHHANLGGRVPGLEEGDFWEAVDEDGRPYREVDGAVVSDPGHALEFVGLALKFARAAEGRSPAPGVRAGLERARAALPAILARSFANGFQPGPGGICKAYDLVARQPRNRDMPWWSLPETMRA
ncbi:MAG: hypothetical protein ABIL09_06535, partial [Gemmatimonadota bacterium]